MKYSLRTILFLTGFICLWLAAIATQVPLLLELWSLTTLLALLLAVPLCYFDCQARRPFWAGFAAGGLGFLIATQFFPIPISATLSFVAELVMGFPETDYTGSSEPALRPVTSSAVNFGEDILYLLSLIFALLGGLIVYSIAKEPNNHTAG